MHGLGIRCVSGEGDMITVQSSEQRTHLLSRGGFGIKPPKGGWTEVPLLDNELKFVKANHGGEAVIEVRSLGGADGRPMLIEQCGERRLLRNGDRATFRVRENASVIVRSMGMRSPDGRQLQVGNIAGEGDGWSGVAG